MVPAGCSSEVAEAGVVCVDEIRHVWVGFCSLARYFVQLQLFSVQWTLTAGVALRTVREELLSRSRIRPCIYIYILFPGPPRPAVLFRHPRPWHYSEPPSLSRCFAPVSSKLTNMPQITSPCQPRAKKVVGRFGGIVNEPIWVRIAFDGLGS